MSCRFLRPGCGWTANLARYDGESVSEWLEKLGDVKSVRRSAADEQTETEATETATGGETAPGGPSGPLDPAAEAMDTTDD